MTLGGIWASHTLRYIRAKLEGNKKSNAWISMCCKPTWKVCITIKFFTNSDCQYGWFWHSVEKLHLAFDITLELQSTTVVEGNSRPKFRSKGCTSLMKVKCHLAYIFHIWQSVSAEKNLYFPTGFTQVVSYIILFWHRVMFMPVFWEWSFGICAADISCIYIYLMILTCWNIGQLC